MKPVYTITKKLEIAGGTSGQLGLKWALLLIFVSCSYEVAPEQKARTTYDNILRVVKDPEVCDPIRFLRKREIIHFQRFGEALRGLQDRLDSRNFYAFNPSFDKAPSAQMQSGRMGSAGSRCGCTG